MEAGRTMNPRQRDPDLLQPSPETGTQRGLVSVFHTHVCMQGSHSSVVQEGERARPGSLVNL